jgi:hypothetical protein
MNGQVSCRAWLGRCTPMKTSIAGGLALLLLGCSSQTSPGASAPLPRVSVITVQTRDGRRPQRRCNSIGVLEPLRRLSGR